MSQANFFIGVVHIFQPEQAVKVKRTELRRGVVLAMRISALHAFTTMRDLCAARVSGVPVGASALVKLCAAAKNTQKQQLT